LAELLAVAAERVDKKRRKTCLFVVERETRDKKIRNKNKGR
jgi:hypothetical protein